MQTLPEAPGAKGQPPRPPIEASKLRHAHLHRGQDVRDGHGARVVGVERPLDAGEARHQVLEHARDLRGLAMPVVSARPMPSAPRSTSRATTDSSWATGTSPSNGQPKEQEMPA